MVYFIVNDEKTVVRFCEYLYWNGRVLRIMLGNIQLELVGNL